jgi:hypothetical protein
MRPLPRAIAFGLAALGATGPNAGELLQLTQVFRAESTEKDKATEFTGQFLLLCHTWSATREASKYSR